MQFAFPSCYSCCNSADFFFKVEIERERGRILFFLFSFSNGLQEKKRNLFSRVIINKYDSMKIILWKLGREIIRSVSIFSRILRYWSIKSYVLFPSPSRLKFQKTIPAIRTIFIEQIGQKWWKREEIFSSAPLSLSLLPLSEDAKEGFSRKMPVGSCVKWCEPVKIDRISHSLPVL